MGKEGEGWTVFGGCCAVEEVRWVEGVGLFVLGELEVMERWLLLWSVVIINCFVIFFYRKDSFYIILELCRTLHGCIVCVGMG